MLSVVTIAKNSDKLPIRGSRVDIAHLWPLVDDAVLGPAIFDVSPVFDADLQFGDAVFIVALSGRLWLFLI